MLESDRFSTFFAGAGHMYIFGLLGSPFHSLEFRRNAPYKLSTIWEAGLPKGCTRFNAGEGGKLSRNQARTPLVFAFGNTFSPRKRGPR